MVDVASERRDVDRQASSAACNGLVNIFVELVVVSCLDGGSDLTVRHNAAIAANGRPRGLYFGFAKSTFTGCAEKKEAFIKKKKNVEPTTKSEYDSDSLLETPRISNHVLGHGHGNPYRGCILLRHGNHPCNRLCNRLVLYPFLD